MNRQEATFEQLLKERFKSNTKVVNRIETEKNPPPTKADKSADLEDFMEMVGKVVSKALKKKKVEFQPDEGARLSDDMLKKLDHPVITFSIINMVPKGELKPRIREKVNESLDGDINKNAARPGRVSGQKFKCTVQFNIIANDYKQSTAVMKDFEELIFNYTAYFKRNGVAELLFSRRFTDQNLDEYRQSTSIRSLQYYVEIERLYAEFLTETGDIAVE